MSSTHIHLPSLEVLKEDVNKNGIEKVIKRYSCYEFLIGSSESLEFLREKYDEFKKGGKDENAI